MSTPATWSEVTTGAADTAVALTHAATGNQRHFVCGFNLTVIGAAVEASDILIEIKRGTTVLYRDYLAASAPRGSAIGFQFQSPLQAGDGEAVSLEVAAAGTGTQIVATLWGFTR